MTREIAGRVFRFGAFEVDEATGELRKQGIRIKLHSQPFQILVMLLERPSEWRRNLAVCMLMHAGVDAWSLLVAPS